MRFAFLVAWREYAENAKTRGFWIGLCMFPLIIFISVKVSVLLGTKATPTRYYALVDQSGQFNSLIESRLKQLKKPESTTALLYQSVAVPEGIDANADLTTVSREFKPYLRHEKNVMVDGWSVELTAAILIPPDIIKHIVHPKTDAAWTNSDANGIEYWSANLAEMRLRDEISQVVNKEVRRREYLAHGMDVAVVRQIEQTYAPLASLNPEKEAGQEAVSRTDVIGQWAPSGFVYLLWVAILGISHMLLNNIIEEKSNRIIEVLLSSVTPGELMMGKLMGIAAIGLTMVAVWLIALFNSLGWASGGSASVAAQVLNLVKTTNLVPMFVIYFLLGYIMYASIILAIGSVCNTIKEAQTYMAAITTTMMVPLMTMPFIPRDPNGPVARLLSWIPIYTPFTMLNRVNAHPPMVDLIGTIVLLLVFTPFCLWMAGKVFRIGILRTGQPPKIVEILRWLRN
jgi:ABC-2 type transport system permease protein